MMSRYLTVFQSGIDVSMIKLRPVIFNEIMLQINQEIAINMTLNRRKSAGIHCLALEIAEKGLFALKRG